jgi:hypothetical protein
MMSAAKTVIIVGRILPLVILFAPHSREDASTVFVRHQRPEAEREDAGNHRSRSRAS